MSEKNFLIHMQSGTYTSSLALEKQELAFALAAFAQPVSLLFSDVSVLQLTKDRCPNTCKDFTKAYGALELFGIKRVYVHRASAEKYNVIDKINLDVKYIDNIENLLSKHEVVI